MAGAQPNGGDGMAGVADCPLAISARAQNGGHTDGCLISTEEVADLVVGPSAVPSAATACATSSRCGQSSAWAPVSIVISSRLLGTAPALTQGGRRSRGGCVGCARELSLPWLGPPGRGTTGWSSGVRRPGRFGRPSRAVRERVSGPRCGPVPGRGRGSRRTWTDAGCGEFDDPFDRLTHADRMLGTDVEGGAVGGGGTDEGIDGVVEVEPVERPGAAAELWCDAVGQAADHVGISRPRSRSPGP